MFSHYISPQFGEYTRSLSIVTLRTDSKKRERTKVESCLEETKNFDSQRSGVENSNNNNDNNNNNNKARPVTCYELSSHWLVDGLFYLHAINITSIRRGAPV